MAFSYHLGLHIYCLRRCKCSRLRRFKNVRGFRSTPTVSLIKAIQSSWFTAWHVRNDLVLHLTRSYMSLHMLFFSVYFFLMSVSKITEKLADKFSSRFVTKNNPLNFGSDRDPYPWFFFAGQERFYGGTGWGTGPQMLTGRSQIFDTWFAGKCQLGIKHNFRLRLCASWRDAVLILVMPAQLCRIYRSYMHVTAVDFFDDDDNKAWITSLGHTRFQYSSTCLDNHRLRFFVSDVNDFVNNRVLFTCRGQ